MTAAGLPHPIQPGLTARRIPDAVAAAPSPAAGECKEKMQ